MFSASVIRNYVSIVPVVFVLAACGGGGPAASGGDSGAGAGSGPGEPVSSTGVITGFGSVYLNGVKYEVESDTRVAIEDEPETVGDDSPLRLGMKVRVQGSEEVDGSRVARRIEFDGDLKGPVRDVRADSSRATLGSFSVLGQKVTVDANTIIDNAVGDNNGDGCLDYKDLGGAGGEIVARVSGFPLDDGILATRVDRMDPGAGEVQVRGRVTGVADIPVSVVLNGNLVVNLGSALYGGGLSSAADLNAGSFIEVKGGRVSDSVIDARVIEPVGKLGIEDRGEYEIAGVLQAVNTSASPHEAVINGISFRVSDAAGLADKLGMRVEVKGRLDDNDVLVLEQNGVRTELENSIHSVDLLASVDSGAGTLKSRLGLSITPGGRSRVSDATRTRINMHLDDFIKGLEGKGDSSGLPVVVDSRGYPGQGGGVTWTRVDIGPVGSGEGMVCMIRGPVESVDAAGGTFTIQGVTVNAGAGAPAYRDDRGGNRQRVSRAEFFNRLTAGLVVMAVGNTEKQVSSPDCTNLYLQPDFLGLKDEDGVYGTVSGR